MDGIDTEGSKKPNQCKTCEQNFETLTLVKKHAKIHKQVAGISCLICDKNFASAKSLKIHIRFHTGESPFLCDICENSFITSTKLKRHYRIHSEGGWCKHCGKVFFSKDFFGSSITGGGGRFCPPPGGLSFFLPSVRPFTLSSSATFREKLNKLITLQWWESQLYLSWNPWIAKYD